MPIATAVIGKRRTKSSVPNCRSTGLEAASRTTISQLLTESIAPRESIFSPHDSELKTSGILLWPPWAKAHLLMCVVHCRRAPAQVITVEMAFSLDAR